MIPDQAVYMAACHFYLMFNRGDVEDPSPIPEFASESEERGIRSAARFAWALRDEVERTNPAVQGRVTSPRVRTRLKPEPAEIKCACGTWNVPGSQDPKTCWRCGMVL
jgi:hypothetical protein